MYKIYSMKERSLCRVPAWRRGGRRRRPMERLACGGSTESRGSWGREAVMEEEAEEQKEEEGRTKTVEETDELLSFES